MAAFRDKMTTTFGPGTHSPRERHNSKSRRVGPACTADGQPTTAYRALGQLPCGQCGGEIMAGEVFLRRTVSFTEGYGRGLTQIPVCARCHPFTVRDRGQRDG